MSIVESLKRLVDPIAVRERAADLKRQREQPRREQAGGGPKRVCRVCGFIGSEPIFCPHCLAGTMRG
jgi:rubrerythrin